MPSSDGSLPEGITATGFPPWMKDPCRIPDRVGHSMERTGADFTYPVGMGVQSMEDEVMLVDTFLQDQMLLHGETIEYYSRISFASDQSRW